MLRRDLFKAAGAVPFLIGTSGWAAMSNEDTSRLIVVLLRGAVDGLSVVIPYADEAYYRERQSIAIAPPGKPDGALALDGHFGLHPALASLLPLWSERRLAFVHAAGSPDPTRSHFDAQLYLENGTPGQGTTRDGWMNRLLLALPGPRGATDAISIGSTVPRILAGRAPVATLPLGPNGAQPLPIDQPEIANAFDRLYAGNDDLAKSYRQGRAARAQLIGALSKERRIADNGAPPPAGFPGQVTRLAQLIRRHPAVRVAAIGLGGWDTHINQGNHNGQLADHLRPLGEGLAALARGSGEAWRDTVVVVLSEFGRTFRENGNRGTDHGHGSVYWVLGGAVKGGRIVGEQVKVNQGTLFQNRDYPVLTDYRALFADLFGHVFGLGNESLQRIFAGVHPTTLALV